MRRMNISSAWIMAALLALGHAQALRAGTVPVQGRRFVSAAPPSSAPAQAVQSGTPTAQKPVAPQVRVVRERYPNRAVKVERHVAQDAGLNFVNHGPWAMWDPQGTLLAKGIYDQGKRQGEWSRWFFGQSKEDAGQSEAAASDPLAGTDFEGFQPPILSKARFADDKIAGTWTVTDAAGKLLFSVELTKDVPSGKAVWMYASGKKRREIDFTAGTVNGHWNEWDAEGNPTREDRFIDGCRLAEVTASFESGAKSAEGVYLYSKDELKIDVDWWTGLMDVEVTEGKGQALKQGKWQFYYEDGEKRYDAEYLDDKPVGVHVWWHANGQKETEGRYQDGQPQGEWLYWHDNGLLAAQGEYEKGTKVGRWLRWNEDGRVVDNVDYGPNGQHPRPQGTHRYRSMSAHHTTSHSTTNGSVQPTGSNLPDDDETGSPQPVPTRAGTQPASHLSTQPPAANSQPRTTQKPVTTAAPQTTRPTNRLNCVVCPPRR